MKKAIIITFGLLLAVTVRADVLYWQISNPVDSTTGTSINLENYAVAKIYSTDSTGSRTYYTSYVLGADGLTEVGSQKVSSNMQMALGADIGSSYSGQTFFVELFGNDDPYYSQYAANIGTGSELAKFIETANFTSYNTMMVSSFAPVPEPTSGMMLVFGAALLALRRRKVA